MEYGGGDAAGTFSCKQHLGHSENRYARQSSHLKQLPCFGAEIPRELLRECIIWYMMSLTLSQLLWYCASYAQPCWFATYLRGPGRAEHRIPSSFEADTMYIYFLTLNPSYSGGRKTRLLAMFLFIFYACESCIMPYLGFHHFLPANPSYSGRRKTPLLAIFISFVIMNCIFSYSKPILQWTTGNPVTCYLCSFFTPYYVNHVKS